MPSPSRRLELIGLALWLTLSACRSEQLERLPAEPEKASPIPFAPSQGEVAERSFSALTAGKAIEMAISNGQAHLYPLRLDRDQLLHVRIQQHRADVEAKLLDPYGRLLLHVDSPTGSRGTEELFAVTKRPGLHTLRITAWPDGAPGGTYSVELETPRLPTAKDRAIARGAVSFDLGEKLRREKEFEKAASHYEQALEIWRTAGASEWMDEAHLRLGNLFADHLDDPSRALAHYGEALPLLTAAKDRHALSRALHEMGYLHSSRGETEHALDHYQRALNLRRGLGDSAGEAATANNLGRLHQISGEFQKALDRYRLALDLWEELDDEYERALVFHNRATAYASLGQWRRALDDLNQAFALWKRFDDGERHAVTLLAMAQIHQNRGDLGQARQIFERVLEDRRRAGDRRRMGVSLTNLGVVLKKEGDLARARRCYEEALALFQELGARRQEARVLYNLSLLHAESGRYDAARATLEMAEALFVAAGDVAGEIRLLIGRAGLERQTTDLDAARGSLEKALAKIEALRTKPVSPSLRASYFASQQSAIEQYIDLLMSLHQSAPRRGWDAAAFEASERARARTLLELLVESGADSGCGADPHLHAREQELRRRIHALDRERETRAIAGVDEAGNSLSKNLLRDLLQEHEEVRAKIRAAAGVRVPEPPKPSTLAEIQSQLDDETRILEYKLGDERSFLWVVGPSRLESFELPSRAEIERQAKQAYRLLRVRGRRQARQRMNRSLADLGAMLLGQAESRLEGKRLLVVKEGLLFYIPFAALRLPSSPREPLIVRHEILEVPSASALVGLRHRHAARLPPDGWLALMADPVFDEHDPRVGGRRAPLSKSKPRFARLFYSREEAQAILHLAPAAKQFSAFDFEASRETFLKAPLANYRVLHLATHGLLDQDHPALTRLVFSTVNEQGQPLEGGGSIYVHEIYGLDLQAELVVLSACQTALGSEVRGEGLMGLTQAFLQAGAKRLAVSLWNVDDRATARLMAHFYRALIVDRLPAGAALRAAQIALWREHPGRSPHDWAGFVLQGEWRGALFEETTNRARANQKSRSGIPTGSSAREGLMIRKEPEP